MERGGLATSILRLGCDYNDTRVRSAREGGATWCLRREDLCSNDDVIFFAAKKMTSSLLHNPRCEDATCRAALIKWIICRR